MLKLKNFYYFSDSDHEAKIDKDMKGVAEEKALRGLLSSGEEDEDEENGEKKKSDADDNADGEKEKPTKKKKRSVKKEKEEKDAKKSKAEKKEGEILGALNFYQRSFYFVFPLKSSKLFIDVNMYRVTQ